LAEGVRGAERTAAEAVELRFEVGWAHCASHYDAIGQAGDARPLGDLPDRPIGDGFPLRVARLCYSAVTESRVGRQRNEHEEVLLTRWCHTVIRSAGLAHVQ